MRSRATTTTPSASGRIASAWAPSASIRSATPRLAPHVAQRRGVAVPAGECLRWIGSVAEGRTSSHGPRDAPGRPVRVPGHGPMGERVADLMRLRPLGHTHVQGMRTFGKSRWSIPAASACARPSWRSLLRRLQRRKGAIESMPQRRSARGRPARLRCPGCYRRIGAEPWRQRLTKSDVALQNMRLMTSDETRFR